MLELNSSISYDVRLALSCIMANERHYLHYPAGMYMYLVIIAIIVQ